MNNEQQDPDIALYSLLLFDKNINCSVNDTLLDKKIHCSVNII